MSFSEVERESGAAKSLETLKETFTKHTGCSWEEAVKEVPQCADVNVLTKYKVTRGKAPPEEFKVILLQPEAQQCKTLSTSGRIFPALCSSVIIHALQTVILIFCDRVITEKKKPPTCV